MSTLTVAAIQYDIQWLQPETNFSVLEVIIEQYFRSAGQIDLLLLPETFATAFCIDDKAAQVPENGGKTLSWLKKIARQYHCVVAGSVLVSYQQKQVNRFYWVHADGLVQYYDKRHLFRLGNEQDHVAQGQDRKIITINGINILPLVCYDLRFPVWSRNRQDYDVIVNVANWPAVRRSAWDTLLKARAIENQAFVIGVNRIGNDANNTAHSGGTAVIDFYGNTLVRAIDDQQQVISTRLDMSALTKFKHNFPAFLDADDFTLN